VNAWQETRHQVALAGRVLDAETGKPIRGAEVTITNMPVEFKRKIDGVILQMRGRENPLSETPDRTLSRSDGLFYFLDLPDGKYTLKARIPNSGRRYGEAHQDAAVRRDAQATVQRATVNIQLHPTVVKGRITASGQKSGVLMAEVRIKGSGERTFSDKKGNYAVVGIEPGKRMLQVFAQGYREILQAVTLTEPGAAETLNFTLIRETE
jgi:hypothetical protein